MGISYDAGTGLIEVTAVAFDAETAQAITQAVLRESQDRINALNTQAREDAMRYARADLEEAVAQLMAGGRAVYLISGEAPHAVEALAQKLGITHWMAEALPADKVSRINDLTTEGRRVLMVGDGLNDTAALAGAHVSISPASALDAARVASDIVLLGGDLSPIPEALDVARSATARIKENFRIATLYNVIAVPVAIIGLATPLIAALAMSLSSITVSLNALRLARGARK